MRNILEGLRANDLEDMCLPIISIDEYLSKVDKSAVVIGFYVHEIGAAEDLNRFIQRTPIPILDTEIAPSPDQQGYYLVFLEIMNNDRFLSSVDSIISEVSSLVNIQKWSMHVRGSGRTLPYTRDKLKTAMTVLAYKDNQENSK